MRVTGRRALYDHVGPFATAYIEPMSPGSDAAKTLELRWRGLAEQLETDGADPATIKAIGAALNAEQAGRRVADGYVAVASNGELHWSDNVDDVCGGDQARWAPLPHLAPAARATAGTHRQLVVVVDSQGADLRVRRSAVRGYVADPGLTGPASSSAAELGSEWEVAGATHPVHKATAGAWSHKRMQNRVEETVERNVDLVAEEVSSLARHLAPGIVVLAGEVGLRKAVQHKLGNISAPVADTEHGGRGTPDDDAHLWAAVDEVAQQTREEVRRELVDRFGAGLGTGFAVQGISEVFNAFRMGAVETMLLGVDVVDTGTPPAAAGRPVRVDAEPTSAEVVDEAAAAADPSRVDRADAALVRAAVATSADIETVSTEECELADGVGAVLRFPKAEGI